MQDEKAATPAEATKTPRLSRFTRWWGNTRELATKAREAPVQSAAASLMFIVLGWIGQDGYVWAKGQLIKEEDYIETIAEQQRQGFEDLKAGLDALRGEVGGNALGEVRDAVRALERTNTGNLDKLRLATQENETLRRSLAQAGKVSGGYDVILSEHESFQLDPGTVVGVNFINMSYIGATLSTPDNAGSARQTSLRPGESLPFTRRTGEKCAVTLLSLREGTDAASFAVNCEARQRA